MPGKILLVDGTNFACRVFYALKDYESIPKKRMRIALMRWLDLLKEIRRDSFSGVYFFFDGMGKRDRSDPNGYKAHRADPETAMIEFEMASSKLLRYIGFPVVFPIEGRESDDDIAAVCFTLLRNTEHEIFIYSRDKDFAQLVRDRVSLVLPTTGGKDTVLDSAGVKLKYGVEPRQIADYLALVGDKSDNIKGVPGIGPKKGVSLLERFESLDGILSATKDELSEVVGDRLGEKVFNAKHLIETYFVATSLRERKVSLPKGKADKAKLASLLSQHTILADPDQVLKRSASLIPQ